MEFYMGNLVAKVAVEKAAYSFDMLYSYSVPSRLADKAKPGCRVMVPFGNGKNKRQGIIFSVTESSENEKLKEISAVPDEAPLLNSEALSLAQWLKDSTFCTLYEAAKVQLPAGINLKIQVNFVALSNKEDILKNNTEREIYDFLNKSGEYISFDKIVSAFSLDPKTKILDDMVKRGILVRNYDTAQKVLDAKLKMVRLSVGEFEIPNSLSSKQEYVVSVLKDIGCASVKEVCYFTGVTSAVIKTLASKGVAEIFDAPVYRKPKLKYQGKKAGENIILSDEQQKAYENLLSKYKKGGGISLLYGVTGSGKTSVYIRLIDEIIGDGKGIIVMVPEISLTPQLLSLFTDRYGDKVAVFHSGLSLGERYDEWKRVKNGDAQIAIGTRSAIFAPFENIGLIIMDEEQEHTYKSEQTPRYHARDVAKRRAAYHKCLCVLSSATPNLGSYTMAKMGKYSLEKLTKRYGKAILPKVTVVDMRKEQKEGNKYSISSPLLKALEDNIKNGYQSILLMNRRGYNTFAACDECGHVRSCPQCSVSLTYHADNGRLMCHYCGYSEVMSKTCPECKKSGVRFSGSGTQKVQDELKELLPDARVLRMDTDSMMTRYAYEDKLGAFSKGEYDILLGTQMVAKGLDFEKVTLVGILAADNELNGGDYMSGERAFDILTQVIGRAGRGDAKGNAIIQTITPDSSIIHMAQRQDYDSFYDNEIYIRKFMVYPPFCDICSLTFSGDDEFKVLGGSRCFIHGIEAATKEKYTDQKLIVLGPMPPKIGKLNGKFRYRIIIKCRSNKNFRAMISELLIMFSKNKDFKDISISVDINPESLE